MDDKDRQIIRALQRDGRMSNQELASAVNLSASPCLRRLRNLEKDGVIVGYAARVDPKAYGLAITAFVRIRLERHDESTVQTFEREVARMEEVLECHVMTGQTDYQLRVVVESLEAYEDFIRARLHRVGGIGSIDSSFAYGTVKDSMVFPNR
ncbi:Lrp/AsnC family transcriptional regulator [Mesobacterium sp. TK19101]|uniref:Lrp/AsnC family transcriptional regulator n=1 Tax=Mesobacterium hydrothermale TaxID=3111907 RepID=A0ABU6HLS7_9RHOB|nr:Lrp/AsnC family transcriptional regulator [Mesobacterium sp. TK19101]MEC3863266.1 Lrp/AsnC family transcriptional regulator [Mesobacterium sp. TK19101]